MVPTVDFLCPPRPCSTRAQVTDEDIESFEETYRGSEEEKRDVLQYYSRFKGDMDKARQRKGGGGIMGGCLVVGTEEEDHAQLY